MWTWAAMVQSAPVSVTKKAIQSKAEQFSTCMYVLCMCMYLFACERVLLAGVDVGWLCWARLLPLAQFREPLNSRFVCLCVRVHICYLHEKAVLYV